MEDTYEDLLRTQIKQQTMIDYLELTRRHGIDRLMDWIDLDAAVEALEKAFYTFQDPDPAVRRVLAAAFNLDPDATAPADPEG